MSTEVNLLLCMQDEKGDIVFLFVFIRSHSSLSQLVPFSPKVHPQPVVADVIGRASGSCCSSRRTVCAYRSRDDGNRAVRTHRAERHPARPEAPG